MLRFSDIKAGDTILIGRDERDAPFYGKYTCESVTIEGTEHTSRFRRLWDLEVFNLRYQVREPMDEDLCRNCGHSRRRHQAGPSDATDRCQEGPCACQHFGELDEVPAIEEDDLLDGPDGDPAQLERALADLKSILSAEAVKAGNVDPAALSAAREDLHRAALALRPNLRRALRQMTRVTE